MREVQMKLHILLWEAKGACSRLAVQSTLTSKLHLKKAALSTLSKRSTIKWIKSLNLKSDILKNWIHWKNPWERVRDASLAKSLLLSVVLRISFQTAEHYYSQYRSLDMLTLGVFSLILWASIFSDALFEKTLRKKRSTSWAILVNQP